MSTVLQADYTFIDGQLRSGVLVHVDGCGKIERVTEGEGETETIRSLTSPNMPAVSLETTNPGEFAVPKARRKQRLRGKVLLPGFINGHSHSFQRLMRGRSEHRPPGRTDSSFWTWREAMYKVSDALGPDEVESVAAFTFMEMLRAGFTHVTEFHYLHHQFGGHRYDDPAELSRRIFAAADYAGIGITLLPVAYQRGGHDTVLTHAQKRFAHSDIDSYSALIEEAAEHVDPGARRPVNLGLAAHSVRALDKDFLAALAVLSETGSYVTHAHVAEQPREIAECLAEHGRRPLDLLADLGLLSERFTAVHATHLSEPEISLLGQAGAAACICPTTERNLGDGLPRLSDLLEAGARLSIGTDSQVRIDPFAEIRALEDGERLRTGERSVLHDEHGQVAPCLFGIGTEGGASATGLTHGSIAVGMAADLVAIDTSGVAFEGLAQGKDPEGPLLAGLMLGAHPGQVSDVWVGGRQVVSDGELLRWESARDSYLKVAAKLWS
jgi:formimidoylglutamate deiminase